LALALQKPRAAAQQRDAVVEFEYAAVDGLRLLGNYRQLHVARAEEHYAVHDDRVQRRAQRAEHHGLEVRMRELQRDDKEVDAVQHRRYGHAEPAVEDNGYHIAPAAGAARADDKPQTDALQHSRADSGVERIL